MVFPRRFDLNRALVYSEVTDVNLDAMITVIVAGNNQLGSEAGGTGQLRASGIRPFLKGMHFKNHLRWHRRLQSSRSLSPCLK